MRFDKLTLKAQEIMQDSQQVAERKGQQQIEPEHVLRAILDQRDGVIPPILGKIGVSQEQLVEAVEAALEKIPRVTGAGTGQVYIAPRTKVVLDNAFGEAEQMKDEYVGLEHILLAILDEDGEAGRILKSAGITREAVLQSLVDVRGGQRITD
ncbi:MAG: type VI secretion system ATPase TssH, partial [bacterium]|nr:type VI secretion system ATPase TssH [bacterium]